MNNAMLAKMTAVMAVSAMAFVAVADSEVVDGVTWYYSVSGRSATVCPVPTGGNAYKGDLVVPTTLGGLPVVSIYMEAFRGSDITSIVIHDQIGSIGNNAFAYCSELVSVKLSANVRNLQLSWFSYCSSLKEIVVPEGVVSVVCTATACAALQHIVFPATCTQVSGRLSAGSKPMICDYLGAPPNGLAFSVANPSTGECILGGWRCKREHFAAYKRILPVGSFAGYVDAGGAAASVISSGIRTSDPTIIDFVYKVTSKKPTVNVRVIAFEDGERNFAKAVVPVTFVDGTDANVGDGVAANVEHKISWQVSSDWAVDLAKVKVEVLTVENGLLPLELMTLPALDGHAACEFSWNAISLSSAFDALLWLYADHDSDISVEEGAVRRVTDGAIIARGGEVYPTAVNYRTTQVVDGRSVSVTETRGSAIAFILGKMGYSLLGGDDLAHVNSVSRLALQPVDANTVSTTTSSVKPVVAAQIYAYKEVN